MPSARFVLTRLSWIAAIVLLVAGLLKTSAAFTEAYHFASYGSGVGQVAALYGIAIGEITLALCLLSFPTSREVWLVATIAFFGFFCVSLLEGLAGRQNCDCFGTLIVRPYYTASLDLTLALGSLFAFWLLRGGAEPVTGRRLLTTGFLSLVAFFSAIGLVYVREATSLAAATGMPTIVGSLRFDGETADPRWLRGNLLLAARGTRPVHIVGFERNCSLKVKASYPLVVEPAGIASVPFDLRPPTDRPLGAVPATMLINADGVLRKVNMNLRLNRDVL